MKFAIRRTNGWMIILKNRKTYGMYSYVMHTYICLVGFINDLIYKHKLTMLIFIADVSKLCSHETPMWHKILSKYRDRP